MSLLSRFKNRKGQVVACPSCSQKLRVPTRVGKTLRITCSKCRTQFDVRFPSLKEAWVMTKGNLRFKKAIVMGLVILSVLIVGVWWAVQSSGTGVNLQQVQI